MWTTVLVSAQDGECRVPAGPSVASGQNGREQCFLEIFCEQQVALNLGNQNRTLESRDDKVRYVADFKALGKLAFLHRSLEAIGDGLSQFGIHLRQSLADDFAMVGCFGGEIAEQTTIFRVVVSDGGDSRVKESPQPLQRGEGVVA